MRCFTFLGIILLSVSAVLGAPIPLDVANGDNKAIPLTSGSIPAVPSVEEIKSHLSGIRPSKILFWSGFDVEIASEKAHSHGFKILQDLWEPPNYPTTWANGRGDATVETQFWERASRALAEKVSGKVSVFLPKEAGGKELLKSIWARVEWPTLMRNWKVKEIVRVGPDDSTEMLLRPRG